ncbi:MAG: protein phosphatase CheZ [SAR324 cluster bacterium]|nr:protein phosphatase CheZ [SAR324 cluster bacterium]
MSESTIKQTAKELAEMIPSQEEGQLFAQFVDKFRLFLSQLEQEDKATAQIAIAQIEKTLDAPIYQDVGKILRNFHNQLTHFRDDLPSSIAKWDAAGVSDNLEHIMTLTDDAANKTMDIAEGVADNLASEGHFYTEIDADLQAIVDDENTRPETKAALAKSLESLKKLKANNVSAQTGMTEILVAQDYQDLTGQLINKILVIIKSLEADLAGLIVHYGTQFNQEKNAAETPMEGPLRIDDKDRQDQGDVDSLLSQFGF